MDAQKHSWPRSRNMSSKEFSSFSRPRLASTTLIIHGFSVTTALTPHVCSTNSSRTCELISLGLTNLSKQLDLTKVFLNVQADNCVKEVKNNTVLRMLAMWICLGKVAGGELTFLTSGHSHEDIDALFSLLRGWIEAHKEIWSPQAFQQCIQSFYDDSRHRPYEPSRAVVSLTRFRDWRSRLSLANIFLVIYIFWVFYREHIIIKIFMNSCIPSCQEKLAFPFVPPRPAGGNRWSGGAACAAAWQDWWFRTVSCFELYSHIFI